MGNKALVYKQKAEDNLMESQKHLVRLDGAFNELQKSYRFPIGKAEFVRISEHAESLAYSDQVIYRFSKLQDCMGAKLFKSVLMYQGENVNKPFLDILNQLESMDILNVDEWFEIRDLRNTIAHDYDNNEVAAINIINTIFSLKDELKKILEAINVLLHIN